MYTKNKTTTKTIGLDKGFAVPETGLSEVYRPKG